MLKFSECVVIVLCFLVFPSLSSYARQPYNYSPTVELDIAGGLARGSAQGALMRKNAKDRAADAEDITDLSDQAEQQRMQQEQFQMQQEPYVQPSPQPILGSAVIKSSIDGNFNGWTGETIYKLRDGHIIQQSKYHYHYHYAYSPNVVIYQSNGAYKIHVEDDDDEDAEIRFLK